MVRIRWMLFFGIILMNSCNLSEEPYNKIHFDLEEVNQIVQSMNKIETIYSKLDDVVPKEKLGYYMYPDSPLYFMPYCLSSDRVNYLDATHCNFDSYLSEKERNELMAAIKFLFSKEISGNGHDHVLDTYTYSFGFEAYREGMNRYFYVKRESVNSPEKTNYMLKIYDVKNNLVLIGDSIM